ncbi:MAG: PAS domain-containing sensor histidine kinase, partial [Hyphomicrobiales bacterium]|nr:PAS domain-containing sensor histidine kinase [Hyphomicrobiales bacterium]
MGISSTQLSDLLSTQPLADLVASGQPVFAVGLADSAIVWANDGALALLGANTLADMTHAFQASSDPSIRQLARLAARSRSGKAPQLQRLRFRNIGRAGAILTVRCWTVAGPDGQGIFWVAALDAPQSLCKPSGGAILADNNAKPEDARPDDANGEASGAGAAPQVPVQQAPESGQQNSSNNGVETSAAQPKDTQSGGPAAAISGGLARKGNVRFMWRSDGNGKLVSIDDALCEVMGCDIGELTGKTFDALIETLPLQPGGPLRAALARRDTWSRIEVLWPFANSSKCAPVTLGGLPSFDRAGLFDGYSGFGVIHLDDIADRPQLVSGRADGTQGQDAVAGTGGRDDEGTTGWTGSTQAGEEAGVSASTSNVVSLRAWQNGNKPAPEPASIRTGTPSDSADAGFSGSDETQTGGERPGGEQRPDGDRPGDDRDGSADIGSADTEAAYTMAKSSPPSDEGDDAAALQLNVPKAHPDGSVELSATERNAFREIARALGARTRDNTGHDNTDRDLVDRGAIHNDENAEPAADKGPDLPAGDREPAAEGISEVPHAAAAAPLAHGLFNAEAMAGLAAAIGAAHAASAGKATAPEAGDAGSDEPAASPEVSSGLVEREEEAASTEPLDDEQREDRLLDTEAPGSGPVQTEVRTDEAPQSFSGTTEQEPAEGNEASGGRDEGGDGSRPAGDGAAAALAMQAAGTTCENEQPSAPPAIKPDKPSEKGVAALMDRLGIGVLLSQDGEAVYANQPLLNRLGYRDFDAFQGGGGISRMFRGRDPELLAREAAGGAIPVITRDGDVLAMDGKAHSASWNGSPATLLTMQPSQMLEREAKLRGLELDLRKRESEVRELHSILDTATDGVAIIDEDGRILSLNGSGQALFGYDQNEVVGEKFTILLARESHAGALDYFNGLKSNGVRNLLNDGREMQGRASKGGAIPLFMTIGCVSNGPEQRFCAVLRDVTQWKKAERELSESRHEAERTSSLKSEFLAKISHEVRTPLNAILGFAEVIIDERFGPVSNERYKDYLKDIHASGTHVLSLINDLLDLSKIEAGKMDLDFGSVDVSKVVNECVSIMQSHAIRERVIMRLSLAPRLPNVVADERSLRQIILNILSNAVKYNEPGGQVIVSTALTDAGSAVIRVRDTGIGMSDKDVEMALEP